MDKVTTLRRRLAGGVVTAALLTGGLSLGLASAAHAETDCDSQPGSTAGEDSAGTPCPMTNPSFPTAPDGTPWVADQFTYVGTNYVGLDFYSRNDGQPVSDYDTYALERNLDYSGCWVPWWTTQVMCMN